MLPADAEVLEAQAEEGEQEDEHQEVGHQPGEGGEEAVSKDAEGEGEGDGEEFHGGTGLRKCTRVCLEREEMQRVKGSTLSHSPAASVLNGCSPASLPAREVCWLMFLLGVDLLRGRWSKSRFATEFGRGRFTPD